MAFAALKHFYTRARVGQIPRERNKHAAVKETKNGYDFVHTENNDNNNNTRTHTHTHTHTHTPGVDFLLVGSYYYYYYHHIIIIIMSTDA